jgi:ATP/maltotriose-dependent transcriptional regulator MalT
MAFDWTNEKIKIIRAIERAENAGDYQKASELVEELNWIQSNTNTPEK